MVMDGAVAGGYAHAVAVITHALDDTALQVVRVERAFRQERAVEIRRCKTEHVGGYNRFSPLPRTHDVTKNTAAAGHGAAVRLDGRRAVMCLDLAADGLPVIKPHHSGIIAEGGNYQAFIIW